MRKRWFLVGMIFLLMLGLLSGCGIPQEKYNATVSELTATKQELQSIKAELETIKIKLTGSEATVTTLQTDLASANSTIKNLQGSVSTQQNINSSLSTELKKVKDPRHFSSLTELTDWLYKDDTNTKYAAESVTQKVFILQVRALRDGYLLPAAIYLEGGLVYVGNRAVIGDSVYAVVASDDRITRMASAQPIPSHPLPLD